MTNGDELRSLLGMIANRSKTIPVASHGLEHLYPRKLVQLRGGTERWWQRKLRELYESHRIAKKGRLFFGSMAVIDEWLRESDAV